MSLCAPKPGIWLLPLKTPTLPPATHTNTYLIGEERLIIVDPGTYQEEERAKLLRAVQGLEAKPLAVVLTHHHPDHIGSARWLADELDIPVWAHEKTRKRCDVVDADLEPTIDLGTFALEVWHVPGHAPGHIALIDHRPEKAAVVGDLVSSLSTIVIDPPSGDMAQFIESLRRVRDANVTLLLPAHGVPIEGGTKALNEILAHRAMREERVYHALCRIQRGTPSSLLPDAYDDTPKILFPLAERSCLAHLLKLVKEGRISRVGEEFSARSGSP